MSVKTDESVVASGTGLTPYPGAVLVKKSNDKDTGAADVNMSFGNIHFGVKAISYTSSDSPEKVIAFYRKDMAHFGAVVLCQGDHAVGHASTTPRRGLSCDKDHGGKFEMDDENAKSELKAGQQIAPAYRRHRPAGHRDQDRADRTRLARPFRQRQRRLEDVEEFACGFVKTIGFDCDPGAWRQARHQPPCSGSCRCFYAP